MIRFGLVALALAAIATPSMAQPMDSSMPGMAMPMVAAKPVPTRAPAKASATTESARPSKSATPSGTADGLAGMTTPATGGAAPMAGMAMSPSTSTPSVPESEPDIPRKPPPPPALDHAADRYFDPAAMAAARAGLREEHGGGTESMVLVNLAEYQSQPGGGYRWDGEGWIGGDINRFVVKSEGDGGRRDGLESAEMQGLYSHAIDPYFDLQAGVRQDFAPGGRTYATVGVQGLAPLWFDVSGALFLSTTGELLARLESTYDLRLTERLILQPRVELNFAAQNTADTRTGSGLSNAELGVRLRYEIRRQLAPYIGVSWDRKVGQTAEYARAHGDDVGGATLVAGIRAWF